MVLLDPLNIAVVLHDYVLGNLLYFSVLGVFPYLVPVFFRLPKHWLISYLNWTLEASLLFQTVLRRPIVKFHRFKVSMGVHLLQS